MNKAYSNRLNARSSTGPRDTGSTRLNAVKHGLLAKGITELDDSEAYVSLAQRVAEALEIYKSSLSNELPKNSQSGHPLRPRS
jgi:hypothetical protein